MIPRPQFFKGLGVAKRYCRRDSMGNSFVRGGRTAGLADLGRC